MNSQGRRKQARKYRKEIQAIRIASRMQDGDGLAKWKDCQLVNDLNFWARRYLGRNLI